MILMAVFVVMPIMLRDAAGVLPNLHWQIYLPVLIFSGVLMMPALLLGEKYGRVNQVFAMAIILMIIAQFGFAQWHHSAIQIGIVMFLFFLAFNYLEATLPALISQTAPTEHKGAALGMYSTSQFIGTFVGGIMGGFLYEFFSITSIFIFACCISILWLCGLLIIRNPIKYKIL